MPKIWKPGTTAGLGEVCEAGHAMKFSATKCGECSPSIPTRPFWKPDGGYEEPGWSACPACHQYHIGEPPLVTLSCDDFAAYAAKFPRPGVWEQPMVPIWEV